MSKEAQGSRSCGNAARPLRIVGNPRDPGGGLPYLCGNKNNPQSPAATAPFRKEPFLLPLPKSPLCELWAIHATPTGDCREPAGIRTILSRLRRQLLSERSLFCYRFPKAPFANCGQSTRPRRGIAVNLRGYGQSSVACGDSSFQKGAFFVIASRKPPLERGWQRRRC